MSSGAPSPHGRGARSGALAALLAIELIAIILLSQLVVESSLPSACDEPASSYSSSRISGCEFLEDGGYHAVRVLPSLIVLGFAWLAYRRRRILPLFVGFVAAFVFLVGALSVSPSAYPWV